MAGSMGPGYFPSWIVFGCVVFAVCFRAGWALSTSIAGIPDECKPSACKDSWKAWAEKEHIVNGADLELECSVASGHLPLGLPTNTPISLPLFYEGNYDLCSTFKEAKFCRISMANFPGIWVPTMWRPDVNQTYWPLGGFVLDQCIHDDCDINSLRVAFVKESEKVVDDILKSIGMANNSILANQIIQSFSDMSQIHCTDFSKPSWDTTGVFVIGLLLCFFALAIFSTLMKFYAPGSSLASSRALTWFAMNRNLQRLKAEFPGDFRVLNGVRVISMFWVILGHTCLMYTQMVKNPTALAAFSRSLGFAIMRGGLFAVDTFFFLSAFLAAWGLLGVLSKRKLTAKLYGYVVLSRYLRLTPVYMLSLFIFWKVLPGLGDGPSWSSIVASNDGACGNGNWITNLFYLNNVLDDSSGCMGWSWYLANDQQFFLILPFVVSLFLKGYYLRNADTFGQKFYSTVLKWGPCTCLIIIQLISTMISMSELGSEMFAASIDPNYFRRVYVRPWSRVTPYAVGMLLAFVHFERTETLREKEWRKLDIFGKAVYTRLALYFSLSLMALIVVVFYFQFNCRLSERECNVWFGQFISGYFVQGNWSHGLVIFAYSWCYLFWSLGLAAFVYILICSAESEYDLFRMKKFLSASIFTPLARLTYVAYLLHLTIMIYVSGTSRYIASWSISRVFGLEYPGYIVLSFGLSFLLYLTFEKPLMNVFMHFLDTRKSTSQMSSIESTVPELVNNLHVNENRMADSDVDDGYYETSEEEMQDSYQRLDDTVRD